MPPKPTLDIDISEFRHMRSLMIKVQDRAKEIKHLQNNVLPKLQQQLADTKCIFKGKERKRLLVYNTHSCGQYSINKQKTDKQWLL